MDRQRMSLLAEGATPDQLVVLVEALRDLLERTAKEVRKKLRKAGCAELRQKGSHLQVQCPRGQTTVSMHGGDIPKGTLRSMEKSVGIDLDGDGDPIDGM